MYKTLSPKLAIGTYKGCNEWLEINHLEIESKKKKKKKKNLFSLGVGS